MSRLTTATTRTLAHATPRGDPGRLLLLPDQVVRSPETQTEYHVKRLLGAGGFGQAFLAHRARGSAARDVVSRTMNWMTAPSDILHGAVPKWQARDDVYQVGQLLGMLVRKDADRRIRTADVRNLDCGDPLKEIVHRCIGERRKRYESADE